MFVAQLSLADFRSYAALEVGLEPGVTAFIGPNGEGKTNLVEAVGYLATHGSHRVASDTPLVRHGASRAIVRGLVHHEDRRALIELEINPGKANRARLNRSPVSRPREVLGLLRSILFAPEDLALVKGDPGERRRFLDELLVARSPRFAAVRSDYDRVLKQRNALLKSAAGTRGHTATRPLPTLDVWDAHLAEAGATLLTARLELVSLLGPRIAKAYAALAPSSGEAVIEYVPSVDELPEAGDPLREAGDRTAVAAAIQEALTKARPDELDRGITLIGPHRDELRLRLGDLPARGYASQGESWSFALSLRLAAYDLLRSDGGGDPVLLLDDVFAELDSARRSRLAEFVRQAEQVLVTAAVPDDVPAQLTGARYEVSQGEVVHV